MSEMFKNDNSLVLNQVSMPAMDKTASQRARVGDDGQKMQVLQNQIGKLKKELLI
jgi:hypothetical protein